MERLIEEIRAALRANMFTLGLQGALALIDICAALNADDGRTCGTRFKTWFRENLGEAYERFSSDDVYQLRCGMLHQGRMASEQYSAVVFTLPDGQGNVVHNFMVDDALILDLKTFCDDIIRAVEAWWVTNRDTEPIITNAQDVARLRPDGLEPFVAGVPVLA